MLRGRGPRGGLLRVLLVRERDPGQRGRHVSRRGRVQRGRARHRLHQRGRLRQPPRSRRRRQRRQGAPDITAPPTHRQQGRELQAVEHGFQSMHRRLRRSARAQKRGPLRRLQGWTRPVRCEGTGRCGVRVGGDG